MKSLPTNPLGTEDRLTLAQIESMLRAVLRVKEMYALAAMHLMVEHFDPINEPHCRLLWRTVQNYVTAYGADALFNLPPVSVKAALEVEAYAAVTRSPGELPEPLHPSLFSTDRRSPGLLHWIYVESKVEDCHVPQARVFVGRFLSERKVHRPLREALASTDGRALTDLTALLQASMDAERSVRAVGVNPIKSIAPIGYQLPKIQQWSTGLSHMDKATANGHAACEVYGLLGAYGSGKTIFAVQMVVQSALAELNKLDQAAARGETYEPRHSYLFHYEANEHEIRQRLWSHACEISWEVMQHFDEAQLSSMYGPVGYKEYELEKWKDQFQATGMIDGEKERLFRLKRIEPYIHLVDMSCPDDNPKMGTGYVPEISYLMTRATAEFGDRVGVVVIDYAGICVRRHMIEKGLPDDRLRHLIGGFADAVRIQVATKFQCPVWVLHQLAAAANKKATAVKQHHTDAAEAKNWAENLTYSFQLGVPDEQTRCLRMTCTKARRSRLPAPISLRIDGVFSALVDSSNEFTWDDQQSRFIPVAEAAQFLPVPAIEGKKKKKGANIDVFTGLTPDDKVLED